MGRPTVADLAKAADVSASTVERVLSGRETVRRTTLEHILETAKEIGFHGVGSIRRQLVKDAPVKSFGFLLNNGNRAVYKTLSEELTRASSDLSALQVRHVIRYVESLTPEVSARQLLELGKECDVVAAVTIDHPKIHAVIAELNALGKPVFSLLTDTTAPDRAGFIGANDWQIGRSAGWFAANFCPPNSQIAVLIGSNRYLCQQICEMSFRAYLRENAAGTLFHDTQLTNENDLEARKVMEQLLVDVPDLTCVFVAGGGIDGVVEALAASKASRVSGIRVISAELTDKTRAALSDGHISVVLAQSLEEVARRAVGAMEAAVLRPRSPVQHIVPFRIIISENL